MKKWIALGVVILIAFGVWFLLFRNTSVFTIKKDGEYVIEKGYVTVVVKADDVVIKDSSVNEIRVETEDASLEISNSTIKFLNISESGELNLSIDETTLVEYLNVEGTDTLNLSGDFAMVNLKSNESTVNLKSGVIGNVYSYASSVNVEVSSTVSISNYFIVNVSNSSTIITGGVDYLEIDDNSNNNTFTIDGSVESIVNEGENNNFVISEAASVNALSTSSSITGSGIVSKLVIALESISTDEITGKETSVNGVINERKEKISSFAEDNEIEEEVINTFIYDTGYDIEKVTEISDSLSSSSYSISDVLDLSTESGVTNYQIKEIITYTDSSSVTIPEVVNIVETLNMEASDISSSLDVTQNANLSITDVLDIYVTVKKEDEISTDILLDVKDDYDLSASDVAKLGVHFSQYIGLIG